MKIETTRFDHEINGYKLCQGYNSSYIFVDADLCNEIEINEKKYTLIYQTGHCFYGNDISKPSNEVELFDPSDDINSLLYRLWHDFDSMEEVREHFLDKDNIDDFFEENDEVSGVKEMEDLVTLYMHLETNKDFAQAYFDELEISEDPEDYIELDDGTGRMMPKDEKEVEQ